MSAELVHDDDCTVPTPRLETTRYNDGRASTRCCDCGASALGVTP